MLEPTEVQTLPSAQLLAGLSVLIGVGGPFHGAIVSLYKNPVTVTPGSVLADFDVADFDGYADGSALTYTGPYFDSDGTALVMGTNQLFLATGGLTPNTIFGYILATAARAALIAAFPFATPVGVAKAGDAVPVVPFVRYSGT